MAVRNGERYLEEQIDSILSQTYSPIHLLIRDNASTDSTWDILQRYAAKYEERVAVMPRNGRNIGALGNFAALLDVAHESYIMFSDADDVWLPAKVETSMIRMAEIEAARGPETPVLVHSDLMVVDRKLNVIDPSLWHYQKINPAWGCRLPRLLVCNAVTGCTLLLNPPLVRLGRPIPTGAVVMHDYWLALVAACFGVIDHISEPLVCYRQHGRNDTGAKRWDGSLGAILSKPWNPFDEKSTELFRTEMAAHYGQAEALLTVFGSRLPPTSRATLEAFLRVPRRSFLGRRYAAVRHGFWKTGVIRNISLLARL